MSIAWWIVPASQTVHYYEAWLATLGVPVVSDTKRVWYGRLDVAAHRTSHRVYRRQPSVTVARSPSK